MIYLSKSKYCGLWQCPKIAWLRKYKPNEVKIDGSVASRMEAGNVVGDLAMGLFGNFVEVTSYDGDNLNLSKMIADTKNEMNKGTEIICEASFQYNGLYCAVDILKRENDGWAIYEVKSSTKHEGSTEDKPVYIADIAYQKYVLENCGVNITGTYLVCLNKDYVFNGTLDIKKLFVISDVSNEIVPEEVNIKANLSIAERLLRSFKEPNIDIHEGCKNPYLCGFWKYCTRKIPSPSVFDLYRMPFKKKIDHYRHGRINYENLKLSEKVTNPKQLRQIEYYLSEKGTYVDKDGIRDFIGTLSYPIYFLILKPCSLLFRNILARILMRRFPFNIRFTISSMRAAPFYIRSFWPSPEQTRGELLQSGFAKIYRQMYV